ncbi:LacI family transcriptional regulator [Kitasatospora atroaurantiaca]|uniref:LacI family transcriptional regulator n=2 Tax=Kitasatospora atroaurantiaca TaxID=285545 RepID=A0A561EZM6_9ACTN|nr:LacI family transcriptional regulator [Kitasatospora atroaurantiaca]
MGERPAETVTQPGTVTLSDVAREAGVSLATASRSINGSSRRVRQELRDKVLAAAARLNYSANAQAQAMARGHTNVVGLVVHDIADPYFSSIAAGVMRTAEDNQLLVTVGSTARRPERELDYLAALRGQRGRAAILAGSRVDDPGLQEALAREVRAFEAGGGRVVVISQQRLPVDTVVIENRSGARVLAAELVALGYRRFGVLAGPRNLLTARDRLEGFRDGLVKAGAPAPQAVVRGAFTRDGGYAAMLELLDTADGIECVFAVNDVMAVGAMAACRDRGLTLPGDLALAGFDDIATLRDVHPALTTVRLPLEEIGALALDLVLTAEEGAATRQRRIKGEVVVRASTPVQPR